MNEVFGQLVALAGENMLNLLTGLLILVVGWIIARVIKALVYRLMKKTNVDNRLAGSVSDGDQPAKLNVEKWVSTAVYYLVMLFVLVAFFQAVELPAVAAPLNAMLEQIAIAAPQLLGAALILLLAWLVATVAKFIVRRTMSMTKLDEKLAAQADIEKTDVNVVDSLANGVFWLVFLLFLPAVLGALGMQGLVEHSKYLCRGFEPVHWLAGCTHCPPNCGELAGSHQYRQLWRADWCERRKTIATPFTDHRLNCLYSHPNSCRDHRAESPGCCCHCRPGSHDVDHGNERYSALLWGGNCAFGFLLCR